MRQQIRETLIYQSETGASIDLSWRPQQDTTPPPTPLSVSGHSFRRTVTAGVIRQIRPQPVIIRFPQTPENRKEHKSYVLSTRDGKAEQIRQWAPTHGRRRGGDGALTKGRAAQRIPAHLECDRTLTRSTGPSQRLFSAAWTRCCPTNTGVPH